MLILKWFLHWATKEEEKRWKRRTYDSIPCRERSGKRLWSTHGAVGPSFFFFFSIITNINNIIIFFHHRHKSLAMTLKSAAKSTSMHRSHLGLGLVQLLFIFQTKKINYNRYQLTSIWWKRLKNELTETFSFRFVFFLILFDQIDID